MRWNPRRRKVTSVAYVQPGKAEKKSHWNSLEFAKIIVGAMTPLLIAAIGIVATMQSQKKDEQRAAEENMRVRKAAAIEDLRVRKAAAALLISDLDNQYAEFNKVASDGFKFFHAAALSNPPDIAAIHDQQEKISAASETYQRRFSGDWAQLQVLMENPGLFDEANRSASNGLLARVNNLNVCSHNFEYALVTKGANPPVFYKCDRAWGEGKLCADDVGELLDHFEQPNSSWYFERAFEECNSTHVDRVQ
jgi:hypothetical protein